MKNSNTAATTKKIITRLMKKIRARQRWICSIEFLFFFLQKMDLYSTCVVISIFGQNEKSELSAVLCEKREKEEARSCRFPRRISFHRKFVIEKRVEEHSARTLQKTFIRLSLHLLLRTKLTCISHSGYKINDLYRKK